MPDRRGSKWQPRALRCRWADHPSNALSDCEPAHRFPLHVTGCERSEFPDGVVDDRGAYARLGWQAFWSPFNSTMQMERALPLSLSAPVTFGVRRGPAGLELGGPLDQWVI